MEALACTFFKSRSGPWRSTPRRPGRVLFFLLNRWAFCDFFYFHGQHLTSSTPYLMKHFLTLAAFCSAFFAPSLCEAQTFTPTKRVMIEDHTIGQAWFGWWSPRGIVYLEDFMLNPENSGYEVAHPRQRRRQPVWLQQLRRHVPSEYSTR